MAAPDPSLPRNIPDMSLPERGEKKPEPLLLPDVKLPTPVENVREIAMPSHEPPPSSSSVSWTIGQQVLAPWEPNYLYVGSLSRIKGNEAFIEFDDGDAGWVPLGRVRPLELHQGQRALSRKSMGPTFHACSIARLDGDQVKVRFDDGTEEWTEIAALRIPCEPGEGAKPTQVASHMPFYENLAVDTRVLAPWTSDVLFPGTVTAKEPTRVHVRFDDGNAGWVQLNQILPLSIPVGAHLVFQRIKNGEFVVAQVIESDGEDLFLELKDGSRVWTSVSKVAIPCTPFGPPAQATHTKPAPNSTSAGWSIFAIISIALLLLRLIVAMAR
jgi:hypothetical protein